MTSLNGVVMASKLVISVFVQRLIALHLGEVGVHKIGQLRDMLNMVTTFSALGTFNGVVKHIAEAKYQNKQLKNVLSTSFLLTLLGSFLVFVVLFFSSGYVSESLFGTREYAWIIKIIAVLSPTIGIQRLFYAVANGLSVYKKIAIIDFVGYLLTTGLTLILLFTNNLEGVFLSIIISPIFQLVILIILLFHFFKKRLKLTLSIDNKTVKSFMVYAMMAFVSSILINYVSIDIRNMLTDKLSEADSGTWTSMTNISKNYMLFSSALFTMYVLPKYSQIHNAAEFKKETLYIYKTLLPIFGLGMLLLYFLRDWVVALIYPGFDGLADLFKWQLIGDFIKLASIVLSYQFLAKRLFKYFIFTEILSLIIFYLLANYFVDIFGVEGVVIADALRYLITFFVVGFCVFHYFKKEKV
ncbi:MAG TPA: O-antigen translocase [Flavobacterium sp.]|nr:O-antigen translocase [Flavobacterium sp.]